ncbi:LysM peptidoglycan-binding domain-containing protein [Ascidiaceihabitans sp.]|uniref:LysM peptidoglycan-binding domain-containing protein n=1 Tax=Ascidiaceihabitans sp. TaxID=1872644 RepID=UPI003299BD25
MSKLAALAGGQAGTLAAGVVVVAGVVGGGAWMFTQNETAPVQTTPVVEAAVVPEVQAPAAAEPVVAVDPKPDVVDAEASQPVTSQPVTSQPEASQPAAVGAEVVVSDPVPPRFDEVRTENDGLTVIAGRAAPGSTVALLVDGVEAARATTESNGAFAVVAILDVSDKPRLLTLLQIEGEKTLASADEIIIAPTPKANVDTVVAKVDTAVAKVVATPEPEANPEPEPEAAPAIEPAIPLATAEVQPAPTPTPTPTPEAAIASVPVAKADPVATPAPELAPEPTPELAPEPTPEPETQIAVLKADEDGVEVLNRSSAPEVMANVAIDTISYSDVGDVLLSGRAQSRAQAVRVYLNNAPVTTLNVDGAGRWRGDLPDVDTGVYTLRVDEVDDEGAVTSRVETPFKREDPQVLAAAQSDDRAPIAAITVQTGATLWAIARDRYGDGTLYVRVLEANSDAIKNPDLIYPGQIFDLPEDP